MIISENSEFISYYLSSVCFHQTLDMFGIINAKVSSKGRYGRTKRIKVNLPKSLVDKIDESILREL